MGLSAVLLSEISMIWKTVMKLSALFSKEPVQLKICQR